MSATKRSAALQRFSQNRLFEGIDSGVLKKFRRKIDVLRLQPGQVVFREGEPGDSLYLVAEGAVKISRPGDMVEPETISYVNSGNFFGATSMLAGGARSGTATAIAPAVLGALKEDTFQEILELAPARLHINFLNALNDRVRSVNMQFMRETLSSERLRVAGALASAIIQDLKNPVCIARCCSELIASDSVDPQLRELSKMLTEAVNGILGTTLDLFDFTRGMISVNKREVSIWRLLDELTRQALHLLPARQIQFVKRIRYEGNLEIDLGRMTRALGAVIANSVNAMNGGGTLTFTTDLVQGEIVLRISDTGGGIRDEFLARIFEPFEQKANSEKAGVGLAIVKSIVEAHSGRISISTVAGKGTTVDIRLPQRAREHCAAD